MKIAIAIIVAVLLIGGGYLLLANRTQAPVSPTLETTNDNVSEPTPATPVVVTYTDQGFSPKTVTVPVGTTIRFVNNSSHGMWVGSAMHPTHASYDGTTLQQHCQNDDNASFDQCASADAGGTYEFTFTKPGSFGYHNHVLASDFGSVVVE